jgi:methionine aminotransferase
MRHRNWRMAEYMQDASAPSRAGGVLSGKARFLPRADGCHAIRIAALPRHLLSVGAATPALSELPDRAFAEWLTREVGVAVIPVSVFYADGRDDQVVRFLLSPSRKATLRAAAKRLCIKLSPSNLKFMSIDLTQPAIQSE